MFLFTAKIDANASDYWAAYDVAMDAAYESAKGMIAKGERVQVESTEDENGMVTAWHVVRY